MWVRVPPFSPTKLTKKTMEQILLSKEATVIVVTLTVIVISLFFREMSKPNLNKKENYNEHQQK